MRRGRADGQGLLRWAALDFFGSPAPPPDVDGTPAPLRAIVALLPAGDDFEETTSRLLMRVGFRLKHQRKAATETSAATAYAEASMPASVAMAPVSTAESDSSAFSASVTGASSASADVESSITSGPTTYGSALTTVPETAANFSIPSRDTPTQPSARPGYRRLTSYQRWCEVDPVPGA